MQNKRHRSYSVLLAHLVKLIDAHYASIGQNHRTALEIEIRGARVSHDRRGQTGCRTSLARRVEADGSNLAGQSGQYY